MAKRQRYLTLLAIAATRVRAANVVDMLSFGIGDSVSTNGRDVSGWHLAGSDGYLPEVLSDRIMLTPPSPGSKRGSAWAEKSSPYTEWTLDLAFRAAGPERGGGNLQLWYAKDGEKEVAASSVYTVGGFDGLAILVDQYGSKGGSIRGFLNDGTKSYNAQHSVDQLAFGHCDYAYRNRGLFSHLTLRQSSDSFEVLIDDQQCFRTHKVKLPSGYQFGVSAASAETPDSFEVSQLIVSASASSGESNPPPPPPSSEHREASGDKQTEHETSKKIENTPDTPASNYKDNAAQFEDLHNRMQTLQHELASLVLDFDRVKGQQEERHALLVSTHLKPIHELQNQINERLRGIEGKVSGLDTDSFKAAVKEVHDALKVNHESIMGHLPNLSSIASPRIGFFVFVVIAFQLLLAGSYVLYKRRKNNMPKKYL